MEKKTIGKFISALRRASGMTQKELGDKLYVSDKTVSRWECDECLPELSLIPAIAEIFDITADELLRGQRNRPEGENAGSGERQKEKSEKQLKMLLHKNEKKFSNLSFISICLILAGIITAMICNGFYKSLLGGLLGLVFFIAATICQICFTNSFSVTDYEEEHENIVKLTNTKLVKRSVKIIFAAILAALFCLPLLILGGANHGLAFEDIWLPFGLAISVLGFILGFCLYKLFVIPAFIKNGTVYFEENESVELKENQQLIKKIAKVALIVLASCLALAIIHSIIDDSLGYVKKHTFDTREEMKEFLENQYDEWYYEVYGKTVVKDSKGVPQDVEEMWITVNGFAQVGQHVYYPEMELTYDRNGRFWFYSNPNLNYMVTFNEDADNTFYRVITDEDYYNGVEIADIISVFLLLVSVADVLASVGYYIYKTNKKIKDK